MMISRGRYSASDLVRSYEPHLRWRCIGCFASLTLAADDNRVGTGRCPRCERCGDLTAPVHGETRSKA